MKILETYKLEELSDENKAKVLVTYREILLKDYGVISDSTDEEIFNILNESNIYTKHGNAIIIL